jgi:hypothetical protein
MPFATSFIVPSPPQAMMNVRPFSTPRFARSMPSPAFLVKATLYGPKCVRRSLAISAHFPLVEPAADLGLTITSGKCLLAVEALVVNCFVMSVLPAAAGRDFKSLLSGTSASDRPHRLRPIQFSVHRSLDRCAACNIQGNRSVFQPLRADLVPMRIVRDLRRGVSVVMSVDRFTFVAMQPSAVTPKRNEIGRRRVRVVPHRT